MNKPLLNLRSIFVISLVASSLIFIIILQLKFNGNITGYYRIGTVLTRSQLLDNVTLFIHKGKAGNDGQFFLALSLDPLLRNPTTESALDNPRYRAKRIMYPVIGYILGAGSAKYIIYSLTLVNIIIISLLTTIYAVWLRHYQKSEKWALSLLLIPSFWIVLSISTADLLCAFFSLATLLCYRKDRIFLTILFASLSILTREPAALLLVALFIAAIIEKKYKILRYLWLPLIPFIAWNYYLSSVINNGGQGFLIATEIGYPLVGLFKKMLNLLSPVTISSEYVFDLAAFSLLAVVVTAGSITAWKNRALYPELSYIFLFQLLLLSTLTHHVIARFPDYTRISINVYLFSFMMLPWSNKFFRYVIPSTATVISLGYIAGFIFENI
jgi:hypothetical protein